MRLLGKGDSYHTPLALRTGILHSYGRTLIIAIVEFAVTMWCALMSGVAIQALTDPWLYIWFPLWLYGARIIRQVVRGFDQIFDIFDPVFESKTSTYASLDTPRSESQERIANLFTQKDQYGQFRNSIRGILFSRVELILMALLTLGIPFMAITYLTVYDPIHTIRIYGSSVQPYVSFLVYWNMAFFAFTGYFVVSVLWIVVSMILSISLLETHRSSLKVTEYARRIRRGVPPEPESVMGYDTFYAATTSIGQFLYSVTFRVMLFIVGIAVYWIIATFITGFDIGIYGYLFSFACVAITLLLFIWPQLGLHNVLAKTKNEVRDALMMRRDELNSQVLCWASEAGEKDTKGIIDKTYLSKIALERLEQLVSNVDHGATWSFRMPTALKLIATSLTPLLVTLAQFFFAQYVPMP